MPEIVFTSVKDAIRWSEETAIMPDLGSSMKLLTSSGGGGSNLTGNEAVDIAQTVTLITANCKPFKGMAAKAVYSPCSTKADDRDLGIAIAANLLSIEEAGDKSTRQLIALGIGAIETMRSKELYDRRYPIKKVAHSVGVTRETFCKGKAWLKLRAEAKQRLELWVMMAEKEIFSELNRIGWMM